MVALENDHVIGDKLLLQREKVGNYCMCEARIHDPEAALGFHSLDALLSVHQSRPSGPLSIQYMDGQADASSFTSGFKRGLGLKVF